MIKEIKTEITIKANPVEVWKILTKFEQYPSWNPFITAIEGKAILGKQIKVSIVPPEGKKMVFKPRVQVLKEYQELRWLGHFMFKGLFDGVHSFELIHQGDGTTLFKHSETFNGIMVRFFNLDKTKKGFLEMNRALKNLVEQRAPFEIHPNLL